MQEKTAAQIVAWPNAWYESVFAHLRPDAAEQLA